MALFPALMFLLGILDFLFVSHAYHSILTRGASVQLVFGFEVGAGGPAPPGGPRAVPGPGVTPWVLSPPPVRHPDDHGADHLHQVRAALGGPAEREPLGQQGRVHALHRALHRYRTWGEAQGG